MTLLYIHGPELYIEIISDDIAFDTLKKVYEFFSVDVDKDRYISKEYGPIQRLGYPDIIVSSNEILFHIVLDIEKDIDFRIDSITFDKYINISYPGMSKIPKIITTTVASIISVCTKRCRIMRDIDTDIEFQNAVVATIVSNKVFARRKYTYNYKGRYASTLLS